MQGVSATRIKQWNDVELEDGIASLEMQLSKEPVLGKYTITTIIGVRNFFCDNFVHKSFKSLRSPADLSSLATSLT